MFVICRVSSISGEVKYLTECLRWSKFLNRSFLFPSSFDADDFLHCCVNIHAPGPFYYVVREVRPASSVGGC